ncbi:MAG: hypothetical protein RLZZ292_3869, partial [Bacteroidota bacterium]
MLFLTIPKKCNLLFSPIFRNFDARFKTIPSFYLYGATSTH